MKGTLKASLKIDIDNDSDSDGNLGISIPNFNLPKNISDPKDLLIIFDDIERIHDNHKAIYGYINSLVEHHGFKLIIIGNEIEIKNSDYCNTKDKFVGQTFTINSEFKNAVSSFIDEITNEKLKGMITDCHNEIRQIFDIAGYQNLRHLKQALWEYERFCIEIDHDYLDNEDFFKYLIQIFLILSIEIRKGAISSCDIVKIFPNYLSLDDEYFENPEDNDKQNTTDIMRKYDDIIKDNDLILTPEYWSNYFSEGYLPSDDLQNILKDHHFFKSDEIPDWQVLWRYLDIEEQERFDDLLNTVKAQWKARQFKRFGEIMHISGMFLCFSKLGFLNKNLTDTVDLCKAYIDQLTAENIQQNIENEIESVSFGWGGLSFHEEKSQEFQDILKHLEVRAKQLQLDKLPDSCELITNLLENDLGALYRILIGRENPGLNLYSLPILSHINFEDFFSTFITLSNTDKRLFLKTLQERYSNSHHAKSLESELSFLLELKEKICEEISAKKDQIQAYNLSNYILPNLNRAIDTLQDRVND